MELVLVCQWRRKAVVGCGTQGDYHYQSINKARSVRDCEEASTIHKGIGMKHSYAKTNRLREWLGWFAHIHPTHCYICGELFDPFCFQSGDTDDGVLLHHIDHDRTKNEAKDVAPVHRGCHRTYHYYWTKYKNDTRTPKAIEVWGPTKTGLV